MFLFVCVSLSLWVCVCVGVGVGAYVLGKRIASFLPSFVDQLMFLGFLIYGVFGCSVEL